HLRFPAKAQQVKAVHCVPIWTVATRPVALIEKGMPAGATKSPAVPIAIGRNGIRFVIAKLAGCALDLIALRTTFFHPMEHLGFRRTALLPQHHPVFDDGGTLKDPSGSLDLRGCH